MGRQLRISRAHALVKAMGPQELAQLFSCKAQDLTHQPCQRASAWAVKDAPTIIEAAPMASADVTQEDTKSKSKRKGAHGAVANPHIHYYHHHQAHQRNQQPSRPTSTKQLHYQATTKQLHYHHQQPSTITKQQPSRRHHGQAQQSQQQPSPRHHGTQPQQQPSGQAQQPQQQPLQSCTIA